jgi:hypothetical protein
MRATPLPALPLAAVLALAAAAPSAAQEYTSRRSATASAAGATKVYVEALAGSLRVEGRSGLAEVRARGTARALSKEDLDRIKLVAERDGAAVRVWVEIPQDDGRHSGHDPGALDMVVEVPNNLPLDVKDSSGDTEIVGVGALDVGDSSGEIQVSDVAGPLRIEDSSGEIRVSKVRGDVWVRDGSGGIVARDVTGNLTVDADGSGSIEVANVGGDFVVRRDGSGGVTYSNVRGSVRVP